MVQANTTGKSQHANQSPLATNCRRAGLTHPRYHPEIDGLRAVAVLLVVIFHAFPGKLNGGFIGVDIFFVISGFLISSIILENLNNGTFSFTTFYGRRIRRIFPALSIVLIASLAFGWFELLPGEYKQLGMHIAGGASFLSNFILWEKAATLIILLRSLCCISGPSALRSNSHSLAFVFSAHVQIARIVFAVIVVVAVCSFFLDIATTARDTAASFYSPQTRFWELLVGSALAYVSLYKMHCLPKAHSSLLRFCLWLVLALIALAAITIHKEYSFPGRRAVLPTVAAAAIISAGPQVWLNRKLLSNRALVWIGLISFPLYLWNGPTFIHVHCGGRKAGSHDPNWCCSCVGWSARLIGWSKHEFAMAVIWSPSHSWFAYLCLLLG